MTYHRKNIGELDQHDNLIVVIYAYNKLHIQHITISDRKYHLHANQHDTLNSEPSQMS